MMDRVAAQALEETLLDLVADEFFKVRTSHGTRHKICEFGCTQGELLSDGPQSADRKVAAVRLGNGNPKPLLPFQNEPGIAIFALTEIQPELCFQGARNLPVFHATELRQR